MDSSSVVTPPYVAGPLRLEPFPGLMLSPARIGDPASARAFARPYRDVAARLGRWERAGPHLARPGGRALPARVHGRWHHHPRPGRCAGRLAPSRQGGGPRDPAARGDLPGAGRRSRRPDGGDAAQPGTDPAGAPGLRHAPRAARRDARRSAPDHEFTDRAEQRHRIWAIRRRATLDAIAAELAPSRALIADGHHRYAAYLRLQQREPGGLTDLGLAMLVDQDDTPLFLGRHPSTAARDRHGRPPRRGRDRGHGLRGAARGERGRRTRARSPGGHRLGAMGRHHPGSDTGPRRRGAAARLLDPGPATRPVPDRLPPLGRGHLGPGAGPTSAPRCCCRLPTSTWCSASPGTTGCCPRRRRRSSPSPAWACSSGRCATNEPTRRRPRPRPSTPLPPAVLKNRRRMAPVTSTRSPSPHPATERRTRPPHTAHSSASTPARTPARPAGGRGTTTRNVHRTSPLGSTRSSGPGRDPPGQPHLVDGLRGLGACVPVSFSDRLC